MKTMKHLLCALLLGWSALGVISCRHKDLCYEHPHTGKLNVVFDWSNAPEGDSEVSGMYLYMYPASGGAQQLFYLGKEGGVVDIAPGTYHVIAINSDTEATRVRGETAWETFELYTREASVLEGMTFMSVTGDNVPKAEGTEGQRNVLCPDCMFCVRERDITVVEVTEGQTVVLYPEMATCMYTYEIRNVENLEHLSDVSGTLSGMSPSYYVGIDQVHSELSTLPFSTQSDNVSTLSGMFMTFGCPVNASKAEEEHQMVIYAIMSDGSQHYFTYDVTDQVHNAPDPSRVHIVLDGLSLPKPADPGDGMQPDVEDWGNEEEVEIPM
ncbi:MAG TPA: DUF5119 domain-containing protein [Candidatus Rikenella faecigallinarum]|uniref:DUF5119 domain-containing protein n=1 Tax=Candidatus Rikenella faecigallinarum TaxID=2838745 RepID=A0A9D1QER0_9BACT|nr:DUF5119 domain-containing protein [Candidatus Rikenella faecigallinarum]